MIQPTAIAQMEIRSSFEFITDGLPVQAKRISTDRWIISGRSVALGECVRGVVIWAGMSEDFDREWSVVEFDAEANSRVVSSTRTIEAAISDAVTYVAA
jgi:hypothetical protein